MHLHDHELEVAGARRPATVRSEEVADAVSALHGLREGGGRGVADKQVTGLQRQVGNASVAALMREEHEGEGATEDPRIDEVVHGGGTPLDDDTRGEMEQHFGEDFSGVRVHTGPTASASAEAVNANAYTVQDQIVFRDGHFDPASEAGKHTLAHELTHVVQQRSGPVDGTPGPGGVKVSDPSDPFERAAESRADEVMSGATASVDTVGASGMQREEAPEEEELQMSVQREEAPEEEELQMSVQREDLDEEEIPDT